MADCVSTSLGLHLLEYLQALNARIGDIPMSFCSSSPLSIILTKSLHSFFSKPLSFSGILSNAGVSSSLFPLLGLPALPCCTSVSWSYSKPSLLIDGRLKATVAKGKSECSYLRTVPCGVERVHTALHLSLMSEVQLCTGGQVIRRR